MSLCRSVAHFPVSVHTLLQVLGGLVLLWKIHILVVEFILRSVRDCPVCSEWELVCGMSEYNMVFIHCYSVFTDC